jgi:uncharacterized protein YnzC (UPF0291/DUF896 family)|tara:strand:+ start:129 stop:308 length:180 start_codon:yes stop_codon:yes gene_type:complete
MSNLFNELFLENEYQKGLAFFEKLDTESKRRRYLKHFNATSKEEFAKKWANRELYNRGN